jgi:hypothetical protein
MANPTTATVNPTTASATPTTTTTPAPTPTSTTTVAPGNPPGPAAKAEDEGKDEADSYRVLKAFTLDDGRTVMPGEKFVPGDVEKWPARRSKQLVDQKYLRPIK